MRMSNAQEMRTSKAKERKSEKRSETEIDDTKNKLKCNLVSMNVVGSSW